MSDAAGVEAAFRGYLEAVSQFADTSDVATGPAFLEANPEMTVLERNVDCRELAVLRIAGDEADVMLQARLRMRIRHALIGELDSRVTFDGPGLARRVGGRWLVADVTQDGRRRSDSVRPLGGSVVAGPVLIEATSLNLGGAATRLLLDVSNQSDEPVVLTDAFVARRMWLLPWRYVHAGVTRGRECPPHEQTTTLVTWQPLPLSTAEVRVVLKAAERRSSVAHAAHLRILPRQGTVEVLEGVPVQLRSPTLASTIRLLPFVPPLALVVLGFQTAAGVVALAETAVFVTVVARWRTQRRIANRQLAIALLLATVWTAFAVFLLTWPP